MEFLDAAFASSSGACCRKPLQRYERESFIIVADGLGLSEILKFFRRLPVDVRELEGGAGFSRVGAIFGKKHGCDSKQPASGACSGAMRAPA
ncbi:hypothetical protein [Leisingera caerulea]|uniref:hypothetical protein n=1 Tax=Leisingera caerulea TaxID=506591 RepID=UPI0012B648AF|nr:hypothetical protein [Leisingera caerulea]